MKSRSGLFITGTDTDVGKTVVTAILAAILKRRGYDSGLFKPVQTGCVRGKCPDLEVYRRFVDFADAERAIIPVRLRAPQAPSIAAEMEKQKVQIEKIRASFYILSKNHRNMLVEGVGGLMVPVTRDHLVIDLIREFRLPALIVARPGLGTINHTVLTAEALRRRKIRIAGVIFSGTEKEGSRELRMVIREIVRIARIPALGTLGRFDMEKQSPREITEHADKSLRVDAILKFFKK